MGIPTVRIPDPNGNYLNENQRVQQGETNEK
jgi:hypothetical protein